MHISVFKKEVLEYLAPRPNENFIDCTLGQGGHALETIDKIAPQGKVLGIDWDCQMIENLKKIERLVPVCGNFANLKDIVSQYRFRANGILADLGFSSWQIEKSRRGFSFRCDEELDMRYSLKETELTAKKIINEFSQEEIEKILKEYGQERFAKRIVKEMVTQRKKKEIKTTLELVEIIKEATPGWYHHKKIHFATRTFQALRMAVNRELENLEKLLNQAPQVLEPGGRIVVISFHSLEDRIIKKVFNNQAKEGLFKILTKKPITPTKEEVEANPRCRSAKLRAAKKIK